MELVGRHHHCPIFIPQQSENAVVQQMRANVRIHSRERIVQKDHLGALVDSAGEVDPQLLPPRKIHTALANLCRAISHVHSFC